jgi:hypothetical protein
MVDPVQGIGEWDEARSHLGSNLQVKPFKETQNQSESSIRDFREGPTPPLTSRTAYWAGNWGPWQRVRWRRPQSGNISPSHVDGMWFRRYMDPPLQALVLLLVPEELNFVITSMTAPSSTSTRTRGSRHRGAHTALTQTATRRNYCIGRNRPRTATPSGSSSRRLASLPWLTALNAM